MKTEITIPTQHLVDFLIQSFRYALPREFSGASIESAERITEYWGIIPHSFRLQIKRDILHAIQAKQIKEDDTIAAWKRVLKLELNDSEDAGEFAAEASSIIKELQEENRNLKECNIRLADIARKANLRSVDNFKKAISDDK